MTPSQLADTCIEMGFFPHSMREVAIKEFQSAFVRKGEAETVAKVDDRMRRSPIKSQKVLQMILNDLPDKPKDEPKPVEAPSPAKSISDEIAEEVKDMEEAIDLMKTLAELDGVNPAGFTEPNDPRFDDQNSVFDGPYKDHDEYKANTYISVKREAEAENTSMHEICRRKGLKYGCLIW